MKKPLRALSLHPSQQQPASKDSFIIPLKQKERLSPITDRTLSL